MAVKIQVRRGTAAEWTAANPVLMEGELGTELDTQLWKTGDGVTAWNSLAYAYGPGLKGDTGATGPQGVQGIQGDPGATWYNGTGDPTSGVGILDDYFLNTTSGDVFKKTDATTWTLQGNIKGTKGDKGDAGDVTGLTSTHVTDALGYTPENATNKGIATGYASLDASGLVPAIQLPSNLKEIKVVADITARNSLTPFEGLRVHVLDATADATVVSGWAEYLWTGSAWTKTAENDSIDVVLEWSNIQNKPTLVEPTTTQTLSNKRITPRVVSVASGATITPTSDTADVYLVTALVEGATIAAPSGTPTDGQKLILRIKDNGTARALAWNTIYRVIGTTLPTTTVINKTTYIGLIYNSADTKWDVLAVGQEA